MSGSDGCGLQDNAAGNIVLAARSASFIQPHRAHTRRGRHLLQREAGAAADFREGVRAFREKRSARFSGR
jgi:enoyl-CoA hydratase/carnithine racemase